MRSLLLLLLPASLLSLALSAAPVPPPKKPRSPELERLQGTWVAADGLEARFAGDRLGYYRDGNLVTAFRVRIVPTARLPLALDLLDEAAGGPTYQCLYRLTPECDGLVVCSNGWNEPRPAALEGPGKGSDVEVFRRKSGP